MLSKPIFSQLHQGFYHIWWFAISESQEIFHDTALILPVTQVTILRLGDREGFILLISVRFLSDS